MLCDRVAGLCKLLPTQMIRVYISQAFHIFYSIQLFFYDPLLYKIIILSPQHHYTCPWGQDLARESYPLPCLRSCPFFHSHYFYFGGPSYEQERISISYVALKDDSIPYLALKGEQCLIWHQLATFLPNLTLMLVLLFSGCEMMSLSLTNFLGLLFAAMYLSNMAWLTSK